MHGFAGLRGSLQQDEPRRLGSVARAQLGKDVPDMILRRVEADVESS
jgi:hypothetical protein